MRFSGNTQTQEISHESLAKVSDSDIQFDTNKWQEPKIQKYVANTEWKQLTFNDPDNPEDTKALWYTPDKITHSELVTSSSGPKFHESITPGDSSSFVNFNYDLGPLSIITQSKHFDYISIQIVWSLTGVGATHADTFDFSITNLTVDFQDLLESATEQTRLIERNFDSVFVTVFLDGIRSKIAATKPPRINVRVLAKTTFVDTAILATHMTLYIIMRRLNGRVYYEPVTDRLSLENMRLGELFTEPK